MSDYRHLHYYPPHLSPQQPAAGSSTSPAQKHPNPYPTSHSDDLKYIAKYRELKRKVKETELDNDRLHLKVLKTRKNIQRLRLERAILYERLETMPALSPAVFPNNPRIFPSSQPPPPHYLGRDPAHYGNLPAPEAGVEFIPQNSPRHAHTQAPGPSSTSQWHHTRHAEGSPRPHNITSEPEAAAAPPAPVPGTAHGSDSTRTFPFVLEYAHSPVAAAPTTTYPAEVRFYPYESSSHPVQRGRRDSEAGSAARPTERELKFRHHRPETQSQPQTRSPTTPHGNYAYPLQHPFLSPQEVRRGVENDRVSQDSHETGQLHEEAQRRETVNGPRRRKDSIDAMYEHHEQRQDAARYLRPLKTDNLNQDQDKHEHSRDARDERQRGRTREGEGSEHGVPPRMQDGEAMD